MSDAFAIAAVSAALRELLQRSLVDAQHGSGLIPNAKVVAVAPDGIKVGGDADVRLNVFLAQVSPNTGWCNARLPARAGDGTRVDQPYLAIDLVYLISAHGFGELDAEILLGHAMQAIHESPGLSRNKLRKLFSDTGGSGLPEQLRQRAALLAEQLEAIKLSLRYPSLDDISKLWSSLNAHYRPSFLCNVSALLIESKRLSRAALPVLRVGDHGPSVEPNLRPRFPVLLGLRLPEEQVAIPADGSLEIFGSQLAGTGLRVTLRNERLDVTLHADAAALTVSRVTALDFADHELTANPSLRLADTKLTLALPTLLPANTLLAGNYQLLLSLTVDGIPRTTNTLALAVAPRFVTSGVGIPVVNMTPARELTVTLTTTPAISSRQQVALILGSLLLRQEPITATTTQPVFKGVLPPDIGPGPQLAYLRVDGVDSLYIQRHVPPDRRPPELDPTQRITLP